MFTKVYFFAAILIATLATIAFAKPTEEVSKRALINIPPNVLQNFPPTVTIDTNGPFRRLIPADVLKNFDSQVVVNGAGATVTVKVVPTDLLDDYPVITI